MKLRTFEELYHVGTMNAADKGCRGASLEGMGLSASTCPEAWVRIARLGGLPWWRLSKRGAQFLDLHALTPSQQRDYLQWAHEEGYLLPAVVWTVTWFDDELGSEVFSTYLSEKEALDECNEEAAIKAEEGWVGTAKLASLSGLPPKPFVANAKDLAAVQYAEYVGLDGVFWEDVLEPENYSAPRFVISRKMLPTWSKLMI